MMGVGGRRGSAEGRLRPPRRFPRLLFSALALSVLVVAVNSIVSSSAEGPDPGIVFADEVRPAVNRSTRQAAALEDLRVQGPSLGREGLRRGIDRLLRESRSAVDEVQKVQVEGDLRQAHGLLLTCLTTRSTALAAFSATLAGEFEGGPPDLAVQALMNVGRDLAVSDRAYELFLEALPPAARNTMPESRWLVDETRYAKPEAAALVATLRAAASLAQVPDVTVLTVITDPSPVGVDGTARVLPLVKSVRLQVVVANAGNVTQKRLPVEAVVSSTGGMDTARQFVDLAPGQRATVALTVKPAPVGVIELRVRAGPAPGEASLGDNEQVSYYVMR
ncbi:MAG: hypothetical protein KY458_14755 [Actinobacteria bacterium]|nr:hypothetical protein [Actinomycetota bacterium]